MMRATLTTIALACAIPVAAGQVTLVGNLTTGRRNVSATPLGDGRIVVAGGPSATVELLDVGGATVSAAGIGVTRLPLVGHTGTALKDGRVVLIGGGYQTDGRPGFGVYGTVDADVADSTGVTVFAPMSQHRSGHTATQLADGRIFVAGGHTTNIGGFHVWESIFASAEILDPVTATWRAAPPMSQARTNHTSTLLPDGRVLLTGGCVERFEAIASAEIFDPSTGTYTRLPDMRAARYGHTATLLRDGRVLIAGGTTEPLEVAEFFNPSTNRFEAARGVDIGYRRHHTATKLDDGTVFVAGGAEDAVLYDPAVDAIVDQVMLGGMLYEHAAIAVRGGVLLIGGLRASYAPTSEILRYSPRGASRRRAVR